MSGLPEAVDKYMPPVYAAGQPGSGAAVLLDKRDPSFIITAGRKEKIMKGRKTGVRRAGIPALLLAGLIACACLAGCGAPAQENGSDTSQIQASADMSGAADNKSNKTTNSCTISVSCGELIDNDDLDAELRGKVPDGGVILPETETAISSGDTVYDILEKVCSEEKIDMTVEDSSTGKFVTGIGGFSSGDAGSMSGWIFRVNGESLTESAGKAEVMPGDVIEWEFVTDF